MRRQTQQISSQAGMTLIEVLIASVILFAVAGAVFASARVQLQSLQKAGERAEQIRQVWQIKNEIRWQIAQGERQGKIQLSDENWSWRVTPLQSGYIALPEGGMEMETNSDNRRKDPLILAKVEIYPPGYLPEESGIEERAESSEWSDEDGSKGAAQQRPTHQEVSQAVRTGRVFSYRQLIWDQDSPEASLLSSY